MCGIWGFSSNDGSKPDLNIVKTIVELADERGGHSFGFFGLSDRSRKVYKESGRVNSDLISDMASSCSIAIGQSRLATFGGRGLENTQPILLDRWAIVHNGNIPEYKKIMSIVDYIPMTDVDTEVIGILLENDNYDINGVFLAIDLKSDVPRIVSHSRNLPLYVNTIKGVTYYCSKQWIKNNKEI
jgi:glucosamine 6-phosphate synthetase-like amidotransferase/phosphosugar isomerase protein